MKKGLLLGAGFSYDLGMPTARELTETFLDLFDKRKAALIVASLGSHQPYSSDRPISKAAVAEAFDLLLDYKSRNGSNYEELLANIQARASELARPQPDRDSYHFIFSVSYEIIHVALSVYQTASYEILYARNRKWFSSLPNLLSDEETWVFSLNHDLFLEFLCIDLGIPVTYGDSGKIDFPVSNREMTNIIPLSYTARKECNIRNPKFFNAQQGINRVKLHGSLSELEYQDSTLICNPILTRSTSRELMCDFERIERMGYYVQNRKIPSGRDRAITNAQGQLDIICKSMLTGGKKYSTTSNVKDGEEKLKVLDDALIQLDELTIIGYGFGDRHVNFRISNAMVWHKELKIRIVDPMHKAPPDFLQQFDYDSRIRLAMCGATQWMNYCKSSKWDAEQTRSLNENAKYRLEIKDSVRHTLQKIYKTYSNDWWPMVAEPFYLH